MYSNNYVWAANAYLSYGHSLLSREQRFVSFTVEIFKREVRRTLFDAQRVSYEIN